jgi:hypothetical protein
MGLPRKPIVLLNRTCRIGIDVLIANPPWKSGTASSFGFTLALHAVVPSLVIACTVPSDWNANTSATPLGLGTAGTIDLTPEPLPGLDQITVPKGSAPAKTVTSADAVPALNRHMSRRES